MASSKAVLVSDKAGCAVDLVQNGRNGFMFEHGNEADLFEKLVKLTISRPHLTGMGVQSAKIIDGWNFTAIAEVIEQKMEETQKTI